MSAVEILAAADGIISLWAFIEKQMVEKVASGEITAEEQRIRLDRMKALYNRVGVPMSPNDPANQS